MMSFTYVYILASDENHVDQARYKAMCLTAFRSDAFGRVPEGGPFPIVWAQRNRPQSNSIFVGIHWPNIFLPNSIFPGDVSILPSSPCCLLLFDAPSYVCTVHTQELKPIIFHNTPVILLQHRRLKIKTGIIKKCLRWLMFSTIHSIKPIQKKIETPGFQNYTRNGCTPPGKRRYQKNPTATHETRV